MDAIMNAVQALIDNLDVVLQVAGGVVIVASLIVSGTRTPDPDSFLGKAYKVIEWLALNVGKAKDSGKPQA